MISMITPYFAHPTFHFSKGTLATTNCLCTVLYKQYIVLYSYTQTCCTALPVYYCTVQYSLKYMYVLYIVQYCTA